MTDYEKLKTELSDISSILEKFPDELKSKVFDILIHSFTGKKDFLSESDRKGENNQHQSGPKNNDTADTTGTSKEAVKKSPSPKKPASESYTIDRNLNLRGGNGVPSFKDFFEEKKPSSAAEINALSIYYLKELMKMEVVTLNHVYTCYKEVAKKPADYFKQSFIDAKNKQGYIEYDENWNLSIPHRGTSFIEHDLPKKKNTK